MLPARLTLPLPSQAAPPEPAWAERLPPLPLAVVAAALAVHALPELPSPALQGVLAALGAALALAAGLAAQRVPGAAAALRLAAVFALAAAWTAWRADAALRERLVPAQEGIEWTVVGRVDGMPMAFERGLRFPFAIERCEGAQGGEAGCPAGRRVRLAWYRGGFGEREGKGARADPDVSADPLPGSGLPRPGERWRLTVRLKRPHASVNPGAFDAELRALEEGIAGVGYVRAARDPERANRRLEGHEWTLATLFEAARLRLRTALAAALPDAGPASGVILALSIGEQAAIPSYWWEVFNDTGVGHLMSISGLHITMLAGMAAWAAKSVLSLRAVAASGLLLRVPAPRLRWGFAIAVAFAYSGLAGWGIPAQRTCWMLAAAGWAALSGRSRSIASVLALAAGLVTAIDPWAPLAAGFWLSFAAVAAIVGFGAARARAPAEAGRTWAGRARTLLREAVRTQWASTLALLPLGALFFSSFSIVGPIANAFAIPLVSALITPAALLGAALALLHEPAAAPLLAAVHALSGWLLAALEAMSSWPFATVVLARPEGWALLLAAGAVAALLAPFPLPARPAAALALLPLAVRAPAQPLPGELWVTAFDVGQGMAVLVEGGGRRLLYDTGPQYGADSEAGARVILPYLRARGIGRLDAVVVSHLDLDHSGGALSVLRNLPVDWVASSLEDGHRIVASARRHVACRRGQRWRWGEVEFEFLHPADSRETAERSPTNARSCVLRVSSAAGAVLLPGDIEAAQERLLVAKLGAQALKADVLVAPHHGSSTSSSPEFLAAVAPRHAIFQVGYRNRFRHPSAKVMPRYERAGIAVLRSDRDGAVVLRLAPGREPAVERLRADDRRYWRIRVEPG